METINKIQINGSVKTDALGNILERSTLLNIRTDDVMEAIRLFNQLRVKMNGQEQLVPVSATPNELTPDDIFPDEEKPKSYNWPFESNEPAPQCPDCDSRMVKRNGKNGSFWGCSNFRKGCRGTRQI